MLQLRSIFLGKPLQAPASPTPAAAQPQEEIKEENAMLMEEEEEDIDGAPMSGDEKDDEDLDGIPLDGAALIKGALMRAMPDKKATAGRAHDHGADSSYSDDIDGVPCK